MAKNVVINGITYNDVESISVMDDTGNSVTYSEGGSGGTVEVDPTLTQEGKAADAKAVGDALADKAKQPLGLKASCVSESASPILNNNADSTGKIYTPAEIYEEAQVRQVTLRTKVVSTTYGNKNGFFQYHSAHESDGVVEYVEFVGHYEDADGKWFPAIAKIQTIENATKTTITDAELTAPVQSVNGQVGHIFIGAADVGAPTTEQFNTLSEEVERLSNTDWIPSKDWDEGSVLYEDVLSFTTDTAFLDSGKTFSIQPAVNYRVFWNGVLYECTGKTYDDQPYLGNGVLVHGSNVEDTGEPFCFTASIFQYDAVYVVKPVSAPEDITAKVTTGVYTYNTMPDEYLPASVVKSVNGMIPDKNGNVAIASMPPDEEVGGGSIESIEQTTKSTEDDGINIITVTLTDGSEHNFEVQNGSKGSQGEKGDKGDKGDTGTAGEDGEDGQNGASAYEIWLAQGNTGTEADFLESLKGADGTSVTVENFTGSNLDNGVNIVYFSDGTRMTVKNGSKGSKGDPGERGADGADGANGMDGMDGLDGTSVTVASVEESTEDGGSNVVTFSDGKQLTVKNGKTGAAGDKGDKGDTGAPGKDGTDGAPGTNGKDGTSVTVSSVTESTEDGGSNVVTFSDGKKMTVKNGKTGAKGDKGDTGADGAKGDKGDTGATGEKGDTGAPGKSAYAYAQDGGYTGTEAEFREDLNAVGDSVRFSAQSLTEAQKAQARENIGVTADGDTIIPPLKIYAKLDENGLSYTQEIIEGGAAKTYTAAEIHDLVSQRIVTVETYTDINTSVGRGVHQYFETTYASDGTVNQVVFRGVYVNALYKLVPAYVTINHLGNVFVSDAEWVGNSVETDTTLTKNGYPADAKKVGDKLTAIAEQIANSGGASGGASINVTAEVGQTIVVKEVDADGKPTAWEAADYQPRTHWSETGITEILPGTTIVIDSENGGTYAEPIGLVLGKNYTVRWNGTEYSCTAQDFYIPIDEEGNTAKVGITLGNVGSITGGADTGEPFVVIEASPEFAAQIGVPTAIAALDGSESVVLSIVGEGEIVHKLNGKFLPNGTPYIEPFNDVILEETNLGDTLISGDEGSHLYFCNLPIGDIVVGNVYDVTIDGVTYQTRAYPVISGNAIDGICALGSGCVTYYSENLNELLTVKTMGVPYSDAPFTLRVLNHETMQQIGVNVCLAWAANEAPERISIRGAYKVNEMDMNCLPDNSVPLVVMVEKDVELLTPSCTWEEACCAAQSGRQVSMKIRRVGSAYFDVYYITGNNNINDLKFGRITNSESGGWKAEQVTWDLNGGITIDSTLITTT